MSACFRAPAGGAPVRVAGKGLVERSRPLRFRFDGRWLSGFAGDTAASALLANGIRLVGRSFKYHRPRGLFAAGPEEPNALLTVGRGGAQTPNVRATVQEIYEGLDLRSQNRWPSLKHDLLAFNDLLAPFLAAGFYYKTFMWPRGFWERLYEPLIRRAAGLGRLSGAPAEGVYDTAWAHCDLLVIGAGAAGLAAALTAARAGADVILADENPRLGGRLLDEEEEIGGAPALEWVRAVEAELSALANVRILRRTTVTGAFDQGVFAALERSGLHLAEPGGVPLECFWRIVARGAVLCAGALERSVAFAGNDRPGVMLAGAVRAYLHRYGVAAGRRVAIFANSDDGWRTARDLQAAGIEVAALIDSRADSADRHRAGGDFPVFAGAVVCETRGRHALRRIRLRGPGLDRWLEADTLAVSGGWNPALDLSCHAGAHPLWNERIAAFVPCPGALEGMEVAGAAAGIFSTRGALKSGAYRAKLALERLGMKAPSFRLPDADDTRPSVVPLWHVPGPGRAWLDLQNDVTVKDLGLAAREGYGAVEHMKRYTTQGMAPDQGKSSNVTAIAVLARVSGRGIAETGTTTFRPPCSPVSIAAMGAHGRGRGFAPERFSPAHGAAQERGAPMAEAGLWFRPLYFPRPGETAWRQSCDREVTMVRTRVGICDLSPLGKIEVFGRDAARFLDFVHANRMSGLKVGRLRYGLMLREDGFVLDDGICARLGRDRFLLTTTTAGAEQVLAHLEFAAQVLCPEQDLRILPVTEQWAQLAIAGPHALAVVNSLLDRRIEPAEIPFMTWRRVALGGVPTRLFRVSFSGEFGFELAVPARYGDSLFRLALAQAETLGGGAFGMEALNVMRIEKGFPAHAEINGRTTADDLGLGHMLAADKEFIGRRMACREGLSESGRAQLVGLRPVGAVRTLSAGAGLFADGDAPRHEALQGHVTSAAYSPTLGHVIGLALLRNGRARHGETVRALDRLRGIDARCEVVAPVFFDPAGRRMRG